MSDDRIPERPEGMGEAPRPQVPRVEVEPSPQAAPASGASAAAPAPPAPAVETVKHTVVKTKSKKLPIFLAALAGLVLGAVLVIALVMSGAFMITDENVEPTHGRAQSIKIDPEDTTLAETVAAKAQPSVVSIATTGEGQNPGGIGSGVVLDDKGDILTNNHVIEGASDIVVSIGGASVEAKLVGTDPSSDLAVIRLASTKDVKIEPIELGDSDKLNVGEWVMAIGSPFGNEQSVSTGIVSALYRSTALPSTNGTSIYANMIQTDAAINPGNSGGALVNDKGELIGINSIIESMSGSSSGVGFAIPVNYAVNIATQILDGKTPVHPYLGATLTSVNALSARKNNLSVSEGALVVEIAPNGPADKAGIRKGDVVTKVDGDPVASADGLIIALREHEVGDKVKLEVVSGADTHTVEVELGSDEALQKEQQDASQGGGPGNSMSEEDLLRYLQELLGGPSQGSVR